MGTPLLSDCPLQATRNFLAEFVVNNKAKERFWKFTIFGWVFVARGKRFHLATGKSVFVAKFLSLPKILLFFLALGGNFITFRKRQETFLTPFIMNKKVNAKVWKLTIFSWVFRR